MTSRTTSLAAFLALAVLATAVGARFEGDLWWYQLMKPAWTPPAWGLAAVWTGYYLLTALAAWNVWLSGRTERGPAMAWWGIQLVLVAAWPWLLFGMQRPGWAWIGISLLLGVTWFCQRAFVPLSPLAARLMLPCLLWLFLVWAWNLATWTINGGLFAGLL